MLSLSFRIFLSKPIRFPKLDGVRSSCQFSSSVIVTLKVVREKAKIDWEFFILSWGPLEEESGVTQASVENRFDKDDKIILKNFGLPKPSELMGMADGNLEAIKQASLTHAKEVSKKISGKKRHITSLEKKAVTVPQKDRDDLESFTREKKSLSTYANTVDDVLNLRKYYVKPKQGSGIRKYKQPKRNAYKISDSSYGNLSVDVPRLINEMKLNVFRGGKLIYRADADKSLIDLLTKRFNPRKRYSLNAVKIFNDLNLLANLPRHPSSGKSKLLGIRSGLLQRSK